MNRERWTMFDTGTGHIGSLITEDEVIVGTSPIFDYLRGQSLDELDMTSLFCMFYSIEQ